MRNNFDAKKEREGIVDWIKQFVNSINPKLSVVIGISGGKDSTVVAALLKEALGAERVFGVLMPNGVQMDIEDSLKVVESLGIPYCSINIGNAYKEMIKNLKIAFGDDVKKDVTINLPPRIRMATLYSIAQNQPNGALVVNTCNKSEDFVGYSTKFGDSAGDFAPIADYLVSEVIAIGDTYEELPKELVHKVPSDGLCGKSDEDRFGFTYDDIEYFIIHGNHPIDEIHNKITRMHLAGQHKLEKMPIAPYRFKAEYQ